MTLERINQKIEELQAIDCKIHTCTDLKFLELEVKILLVELKK